MNERIKELEKQSYITFKDENSFDCLVFSKEKFAELLIWECISLVENLPPGYKDYRNQIEDSFRTACVEKIEQYFGVKE